MYYGGAAYSEYSIGKIGNTTYINNTAYYHGGAVTLSSQESNITLDDSTFTNNVADIGGAVYAKSRDLRCIPTCSTMSLTNTNFTNNTASMGAAMLNIHLSTYLDHCLQSLVM